jgi:hypothetical protein
MDVLVETVQALRKIRQIFWTVPQNEKHVIQETKLAEELARRLFQNHY